MIGRKKFGWTQGTQYFTTRRPQSYYIFHFFFILELFIFFKFPLYIVTLCICESTWIKSATYTISWMVLTDRFWIFGNLHIFLSVIIRVCAINTTFTQIRAWCFLVRRTDRLRSSTAGSKCVLLIEIYLVSLLIFWNWRECKTRNDTYSGVDRHVFVGNSVIIGVQVFAAKWRKSYIF